MAMIEPLTLSIVRTVQEFGKIPLDLLARRVRRSREEVERQVADLQSAGIVTRQGDVVVEDGHHAEKNITSSGNHR